MISNRDVTFGYSSLDRAAHLRDSADDLRRARKNTDAHCLALWRGKPLIDTTPPAALLRLPLAHPLFRYAESEPIFLGKSEGQNCFVHDVSAWSPDDGTPDSLNQFADPSEQHFPGLPNTQVFAELRRIMTWLTPEDAEMAATARALTEWHRTHRFCAQCGAASHIASAGWKRECPSCGASHFQRTDPVVIMLVCRGNSVLVGRSPHFPKGMYSLLAGFVEPGETIEGAVRREVFEETGVHIGEVSYIASQPWPFPASLMIGCYARALSHEIEIDPTEIEDARWVSREEMLGIASGSHPEMTSARKGAIAQVLIENWLADSLK